MQPHHPSFEGVAHNLVSNLIFLGSFPTKVVHFLRLKHIPETFLHLATSNAPRLYWSAEKNQNGGKQNGGSPCYVKMTSFAQIVQVADR